MSAIEVRRLANEDPLADPPLAAELQSKWLVWDAYVAGKRRVDLHPLVLSPALHARAVAAAERVTATVDRVGLRAFDDPHEASHYHFPTEVLQLARASHEVGDDARLVRVDLLLTEDDDFVACEVNADCPGGHNEAVGLPTLARRAGFLAGTMPTFVLDALVDRLVELAGEEEWRAVALLYATAYSEDLQVCALIQRALWARGVEAVLAAANMPKADEWGGISTRGVPVTTLYRFFPTEAMEGQKNVGALAEGVLSGAIRTLSSFAQMFAQSKVAFARATALSPTMHDDDRAVIARHLPRTLGLADVPFEELVRDRASWVVKRALGRVGEQVFVGALLPDDAWSDLVEAAIPRAADPMIREPWIAQRYVRQRPIPTPFGDRYVTLGAYVLDGRFVGYFARLTAETHVSHDALCVPVFVDREAA